MHIYNKKLNGEIHHCEVCGNSPTHIDLNSGKRLGSVIQHHVGGKRYDDRAIWVCNECHQKIHNPTAFGLPSNWAYDNAYLLRRSNNMLKEKKTKTCAHTKTIGFNPPKCMYCGQVVKEMAHGTKKAKKDHIADSSKKIKMGQEQQDPRIKQAENLKKELTGIQLNIKKFAHDKQRYEYWTNEKARVKDEMKKLQASYED